MTSSSERALETRVSMLETDRKFFWPAPGPRPADHPGIE